MSAPLKHTNQTGSPKRLAGLLIVFLVIAGSLVYAVKLPAQQPIVQAPQDIPQVQGTKTSDIITEIDEVTDIPVETAIPETVYKVVETIDGDTIKVSLDGKVETIRLIGVDTPETKDPRKKVQCFGKQASDFTRDSLLNKTVRLAADDSQDDKDKYGRLLRYIYLPDGSNFNGQLIRQGYAYEYTYDVPYQLQTDFKSYQTAAESEQVGLWSPTTCDGKRY